MTDSERVVGHSDLRRRDHSREVSLPPARMPPRHGSSGGVSAKSSGATLCQAGTRNDIGYTTTIKGFRHKGTERFFATAAKPGIQAQHADRLRLILGRLNASTGPRDMNLPGLDLHELRGPRKGTWAVKVSGNWRITFTCAGKDVDRVDYEDCH